MISKFDYDIFVKYASSTERAFSSRELESGWNIISEKSLKFISVGHNAKLISCEKFTISTDLQPQGDVMRSWTEKNAMGNREIFNATHLRQPHKIAVIEKL